MPNTLLPGDIVGPAYVAQQGPFNTKPHNEALHLWLFQRRPTLLGHLSTKPTHLVLFYEDPVQGGDASVIAVDPYNLVASYTGFYDLGDMKHPMGDYEPTWTAGQLYIGGRLHA